MIVQIIIGIALLAFIIYIALLIYYKYFDKPRFNFDINEGDLSKEQIVLSSQKAGETFLKGNNGTISVYIKLYDGDRTININDQNPSLLSIKGVMDLKIAVGNNNQNIVKLQVSTKNTVTNSRQIEVIDLPYLPRQKWTHLTILREGRRFDILYNGKIVASKRLLYVPIYISAPLIIGNKRLTGKFVNGFLSGTRLSINDIKYEMESTSNTRGEPYMKENKMFNIFGIIEKIPGISCPDGLFCKYSTNSPPADPTKIWDSPVA
jgi:hypothetical protein